MPSSAGWMKTIQSRSCQRSPIFIQTTRPRLAVVFTRIFTSITSGYRCGPGGPCGPGHRSCGQEQRKGRVLDQFARLFGEASGELSKAFPKWRNLGIALALDRILQEAQSNVCFYEEHVAWRGFCPVVSWDLGGGMRCIPECEVVIVSSVR